MFDEMRISWRIHTRIRRVVYAFISRFVPQLFPSGQKDRPRPTQKTAHFQAFRLIGETGFEPATARPPAGCATRLRHSPWCSSILRTKPAVHLPHEIKPSRAAWRVAWADAPLAARV